MIDGMPSRSPKPMVTTSATTTAISDRPPLSLSPSPSAQMPSTDPTASTSAMPRLMTVTSGSDGSVPPSMSVVYSHLDATFTG